MERRAPRPRSPQLTASDLELLSFVADHRFVLAAHARALLGVSKDAAEARLRRLTRAGLLGKGTLFHRQPAYYAITRRGLEAVHSDLAAPRIDTGTYLHDVGVAWLWLAAQRGAFGPPREVVSERQMRSHDASAEREDADGEPLAVRLGGAGPGGRERLHYPDLLLITAAGHRVAFELELTGKGRARREKILGGYAVDRRIDAVVYLVENSAIGRAVQASARRFGASSRVHVQDFRWGASERALKAQITAGPARAGADRVPMAAAGRRVSGR